MGRAAERTMMAAITPRQIEEARRKAEELCRLAFAPQPTSSGELLCWKGRIAKAIQMGDAAMKAGDDAKLDQVNKALDLLGRKAREAENAAQQAASDYGALCAAAGAPMADVYPPTCQCEGCKLAAAQERAREALYTLRMSVFKLLLPDDVHARLPLLVELVEATGKNQERQRKRLWNMICQIAAAQKEYADALQVLGERPDWQGALK